ncbi:MAG TPA: FtsX-like permease family protein [Gemmatimonadales bacterium]|jgi:hypothetical protein|nr:FtsX-like permease family protein [Gemmatimonadales bacterium]
MTLRLGAVVAPALAALREHWRAALLVGLLGALAIGLLLPGRALPASLALPSIPEAGEALAWTTEAQAPAQTQQAALHELLQLLSALAWVGFGIASCSIFSCRAAKGRERAAEIGIRRAVGASLRAVALSLLFEAVLLAAFALVIGVALGSFLLSLATKWWPGVSAPITSVGPVTTLAMCAVIGAASLMPLLLVRSRHLVEPGDQEVGLRTPTLQVAASIALLMASAALLSGSRINPRSPPVNSNAHGVVFEVDSGLDNLDSRALRYAALRDELSALPGVTTVGLASGGALLGLGTLDDVTTDCGQCHFGGMFLRWPHFTALAHAVSPDSFEAQHVRLAEGRLLRASDSIRALRVAIVNRQLALRYFQRGRAVGRDIYLGRSWPRTPYRVVGIVEDERAAVLGGSLQPRETVYLSVLQHSPRRVELLLRSSSGGVAQADVVSLIHGRLGAQATISAGSDEAEFRKLQRQAIRWFGAGFGVAAVAVLIMALVGTFYAMRAWAESVIWELSLRRAVGARKYHVIGFVVRRTLGIASGGVALGLFLYASVLAEALAGPLGHLPVADPLFLAQLAIPPALLALGIGVLPGLRLVRRPPGPLLH